MRRRRDAIWSAIHSTPDFWTTLKPLDPDAVRRIHETMLRQSWEVFFITQRPATVGQTVQRQTQQWLHEQGFDMPSVLVISGSRGAAAGALRLTYHVDDSPQNCLDVASDSRGEPILIVPEPRRGHREQRQAPAHRYRPLHQRGARSTRAGVRLRPERAPAAEQTLENGRLEVGERRRDGVIEIPRPRPPDVYCVREDAR